MITVGIDEVGRGCWAGPVVAGAVVLKTDVPGLNDSKLLSKQQRRRLSDELYRSGAAIGLGWVAPGEVDVLGLTKAVALAMRRALQEIKISYDEVIIDGNYNFLADVPSTIALIKADATVRAVSAASIVAKVARDASMAELARQLPGYGFESHVGYGTAAHRAALAALGVSKAHRRSYKPIRALLQ